MSKTAPGTALSRRCPGTGHLPETLRHCAGKHCVEVHPGLLVLWWAPGSLLDRADILAVYAAIRHLSDGYLLPLVIHLQGLIGIAADARAVFLEGSLTSRIGLVGTGPVDRVIAAFLEHSLSESRYFEHPPAAHAWALAAPTEG